VLRDIKKIKMVFVFVLVLLCLPNLHAKTAKDAIVDTNNTNITSKFYESLFKNNRVDEAFLNLFLTQMPKGGDLHNHFSGSIYAETFLEWVAKKGWYIDKCTLHIVKDKNKGTCKLLTPEQILHDNLLYRKLLSKWSDKDFANHYHEESSPDSNFFNTFSYFGAVSHQYLADGLNILKKRALRENVSYLELMTGRVYINSKIYFDENQIKNYNNLLQKAKTQAETDKILDKITKKYLSNKRFNKEIVSYISMLNKSHKGIDSKNFLMRFQASAVRVLPPFEVFSELFAGYIASKKSDLIVGVNILAPENNHVALADYTLHMRMYNYLLRKYPTVHRALHAGELTLGMVRPKDLAFHIGEARSIAKAQRIGHGVDISYENNPLKLLEDLKKHSAIEINFKSNEFILGVKGQEHPYLIYANYGVPIVICTDDSGISRDNLTHAYLLLATRYHPSYAQIKKYVYNSIKYSFLQDKNKKILKKDIDARFVLFEKKMALLYKKITFDHL